MFERVSLVGVLGIGIGVGLMIGCASSSEYAEDEVASDSAIKAQVGKTTKLLSCDSAAGYAEIEESMASRGIMGLLTGAVTVDCPDDTEVCATAAHAGCSLEVTEASATAEAEGLGVGTCVVCGYPKGRAPSGPTKRKEDTGRSPLCSDNIEGYDGQGEEVDELGRLTPCSNGAARCYYVNAGEFVHRYGCQ